MRILIVSDIDVKTLPPIINVIRALISLETEVTAIVPDNEHLLDTDSEEYNKLKVINFTRRYGKDNILDRVIGGAYRKERFRQLVKNELSNCDFIWTMTDKTVRDLGDILYGHRHIMQLMELVDKVPISTGFRQNLFFEDIKQYARKAHKVVVPEENRAHIQKAIWNLDQLPVVLPNKPYDMDYDVMKCPPNVREVVSKMKKEDRRIVLYSGGIAIDRNLELIADALALREENYVFYIMARISPSDKYIAEILKNKRNVVFIPYVTPPYHLEITRNAYIGCLPYAPVKVGHNHVLNAVYCAPNKIYDYAAYGLPMVGSNVPGLSIPFKLYNIGYTYNDDEHSVLEAIENVEENYDEMSRNCYNFFSSVDLKDIVENIISV